MDPQQRIILETVYESLESAGYSISQLRGSSTGVFVGQMSDDYRDLVVRDVDFHPQHTGTGIARSILANRISYAFDWKGPSVNIDTACSSSLVALHLGVQSLKSGECELAVIAGVNLVFGPEVFSFLCSLHMLSAIGRSRMWDADADGYARGEGFAAVVIKSLGKALTDGDDVESIIRNTGVNQDGRSAGLTVPSASAQIELIKSTYEKCGLNCQKEEDRCQYFEAHGTGTPAGDPKEAEAISLAFFPKFDHGKISGQAFQGPETVKMHVGSIKTIVGHLEGTAGLGSLLKASQAVQHGLIPPNLHFNRSNPAIEPYFHHLQVPTKLEPWPELPTGAPRRASVNSFGFGGTNAHAIVENWDDQCVVREPHHSSACWGPFILSANSEKALIATIIAVSTTLKNQNNIDLSRLAWTLQTRRTQFKYRSSFSAVSREELITRLDSAIRDMKQFPIATRATKVSNIRILGVFTGQGAQWPSMGISLFHHSATFRRTIQQLESALKGIPDGPTWSLTEELLNQNDPMRTMSAEISQSLSTALQVALVDLLKESGITFSAVVGHSSGEIAAAYATGVLTAIDAIVIAFYRGYHSSKAQNARSKSGKMMAVGMSIEDAEHFCGQACFLGRISVAAKNSNSSVTLSGDADAIDEAIMILNDKAVIARQLKVDTAYPSHHMALVRAPYLASLKEARIQPRRNCFGGVCNWYSSVYNPSDCKDMASHIPFEHTYWVDNMTKPVLFSHAITSVIQHEHLDLALEIGPHPALRGPAIESIKDVSGSMLLYQGVLERNEDAVNTFSSVLGFVWRHIDSPVPPIDFPGFRKACDGPNWMMPRPHKGLPPYPWDHDRTMIKESKISKAWRMRDTPGHGLLGLPSSRRNNRQIHWRNILRLKDLEWLRGHQFQNQVLLPAAAYLTMAVDAALHLVSHSQPVQIVELQDVVIHNGVLLEEEFSGVEMNFVIELVDEVLAGKTAKFSCYCSNADAASPEFDKEVFTGHVFVKLGPLVEDALPSRISSSLPMTDVDTDRFYSWIQKIDLQYSEPFVLESIKRRLNFATVTTQRNASNQYTIHPGTLDSILHSLYAAFSYPGDGRLWTTYLPKSFRQVRFNLNTCRQIDHCVNSRLVADCFLTESSAQQLCGDIDVFCTEGGPAEIQFQGVAFSSLLVPTAANDRSMFWESVWKRDILSAVDPIEEEYMQAPFAGDSRLHELCERTAYFYLKEFCRQIVGQETESMDGHFQQFVHWALNCVGPTTQLGWHPCWKPHWETDTLESIIKLKQHQYDGQVDLDLLQLLCTRLTSIPRGGESMFQIMGEIGSSGKLYKEGLGVPEINGHLGSLLDALGHKHPRTRVLEIGAGTGESSLITLRRLGTKLESYTFTDPSPSSFPVAQARFAEYENLMRFRVLDIERSPVEQGFHKHSYDIVIAAHVLHTTKSISQTLLHCRELLLPGGYLIFLEPTNPTTLRIPLLYSGLPRWWISGEDGQRKGPTLTEVQWDVVLRDNLFSGVDCALRDFADDCMHNFSVMVSQALDDRISVLRDPLSQDRGRVRVETLYIISGGSLTVSKMATKIRLLLSPFAERIIIINDLENMSGSGLKYGSSVICLSGLEQATFVRMNQQRLSAMQLLFREAKYVLWVTRGCRIEDPYSNIMVGIGRAVSREMAHLRFKLVDVDNAQSLKPQTHATLFSEMLLQMIFLDLLDDKNILWCNETELAVENGAVFIPRVVADETLNDTFNSARRRVVSSMCPISTPFQVYTRDEGISIQKIGFDVKEELRVSSIALQVRSSSLFRFTCVDDSQPFYICLGCTADSNRLRLTMSENNDSAVMVDPDTIFWCEANASSDELLLAILTVIMCEYFISGSTGTVWIHNTNDWISNIIWNIADSKDISVFLTTSIRGSILASSGRATYIYPIAAERKRRFMIPRNIKRFVNFGANKDGLVELVLLIPGHSVEI